MNKKRKRKIKINLALRVGVHSKILAPYPATAFFFVIGALLGMITYAGIPLSLAANANA